MRGLTVTDRFWVAVGRNFSVRPSISNVMKNIGLEVSPVMTGGIRDVGRWIHYCPGCRADQGGAAGDASSGAYLKTHTSPPRREEERRLQQMHDMRDPSKEKAHQEIALLGALVSCRRRRRSLPTPLHKRAVIQSHSLESCNL